MGLLGLQTPNREAGYGPDDSCQESETVSMTVTMYHVCTNIQALEVTSYSMKISQVQIRRNFKASSQLRKLQCAG